METNQKDILAFRPLGQYHWPSSPTQATFKRYWERIKCLLPGEDEKPYLPSDELQKTSLKRLNDVNVPPPCEHLLKEFAETLREWISEKAPQQWVKLIILPPGDESNIVSTWGNDRGYQVIQPPARNILLSGMVAELPNLEGEGVVVIPNLERWFLRHRNGLKMVRALLAEVATLQRHCIIGCNSWAWIFLSKAIDAHMILPEGLTFAAYDEERLHDWITDLATQDGKAPVTFRSAQNGENILARNEDNTLKRSYFKQLAARSLGIPWVAWHLWRRSLRSHADTNQPLDIDEHEITLWLTILDEFTLPESDDQSALLILQAILIHESLSIEELRCVLPLVGESNVLHMLIKASFVVIDGDQIKCCPAAYPSIRSGLFSAGFSMDMV